jgi:hypothetical protein
MSRTQPGTATPAPTTATDVAVGSNRPKRQLINLPPLEASDSFLAELVSALSRHPTIARLIATPELVRATTLAVVQIGDGRTPAAPLKVLRPDTRLQITGTSSGRIDPKSYGRWDTAVAGLTSVSAIEAAQLYVNVKPLFDQAYGDPGIRVRLRHSHRAPSKRWRHARPSEAAVLATGRTTEHEDLGLRAAARSKQLF